MGRVGHQRGNGASYTVRRAVVRNRKVLLLVRVARHACPAVSCRAAKSVRTHARRISLMSQAGAVR